MKAMVPRVGLVGTLGLVVLIAIAALLLMAAAPSRASAQEPRLARMPEPARTQLNALVANARERGLPAEALIDRALEGLAKGAPGPLIVTAVTRLREELGVSRLALGASATGAEVSAGASALRAGATGEDLTRLKALRAEQPLTVAAGVLADLVASGVPADTAIGAVMAIAADGGDADYLAFRRDIQRDIALGISPASAVDVRLRGLAEILNAADVPSSGAVSPRPKRKP